MEDAHLHVLNCEKNPEYSFFAVFDGHGGYFLESFNILRNILAKLFFQEMRCHFMSVVTSLIFSLVSHLLVRHYITH